MRYLLVAILAFSSLPLYGIAAEASPSRCSTVLARSKAALTNVNSFRTYKIERQYSGIPPRGRSQHLSVIFRDDRPTTELAMAKKIIANCPKIGAVSFILDGTDDENRYGLLNGKVQAFKCKDISEPIRWGEYGCP